MPTKINKAKIFSEFNYLIKFTQPYSFDCLEVFLLSFIGQSKAKILFYKI